MKIGVDINAFMDGATLTLKTSKNTALAVLTQPEAEALTKQLIAALAIAAQCDMAATEVLINNNIFKRKIEVQSG